MNITAKCENTNEKRNCGNKSCEISKMHITKPQK